MRILFLCVALAAAMPALAAQDQRSTITKTEIRSGTPAQTHRRLRDVIWQMFEQEDLRSAERPRRALDRMSLRTHFRGTEVPGLCRYDIAQFEFEPAELPERGAATRVQPVGIRAESHFRFLSPPAEDDRGEEEAIRTADGPCAGLRNQELNFFEAENAQVATEAYRAFLRLQRDMRAGVATGVACDLSPSETQSCGDVIQSIGQNQFSLVERCRTGEAGESCHRIWASDYLIELVVTCCIRPGPPDGQIVRARVSETIVFADRVID